MNVFSLFIYLVNNDEGDGGSDDDDDDDDDDWMNSSMWGTVLNALYILFNYFIKWL